MAIVTVNQETKIKLVYQVQDEEGELRQTSRTFSNIAQGASNDAIHAGMSAGASVVRVDESELVSE